MEEEDWRIERSLPENLLHGRPVGSEVFLQPSANFNIAISKKEFKHMGLELGTIVPDFSLPSTNRENIKLSDYKNKKNVLIVFFPIAFTPG